jgi:hypothetical protein
MPRAGYRAREPCERMPTSFHLRVWTRFLVPVEAVWRARVDALAPELGPWRACFAPSGAPLSPEQLPPPVETTVRPLGPLAAVRWPLRVTALEPGVRWVDESENALYARFVHEHLFERTADGCRYVDAVTFTPRGRAQKAAAVLTQRMLVRRHEGYARALAADPQATGVSVLRVRVEEAWDAA